jgi:hypothetical protein
MRAYGVVMVFVAGVATGAGVVAVWMDWRAGVREDIVRYVGANDMARAQGIAMTSPDAWVHDRTTVDAVAWRIGGMDSDGFCEGMRILALARTGGDGLLAAVLRGLRDFAIEESAGCLHDTLYCLPALAETRSETLRELCWERLVVLCESGEVERCTLAARSLIMCLVAQGVTDQDRLRRQVVLTRGVQVALERAWIATLGRG